MVSTWGIPSYHFPLKSSLSGYQDIRVPWLRGKEEGRERGGGREEEGGREEGRNRRRPCGFQGHTARGSGTESRAAPISGLVNDSELSRPRAPFSLAGWLLLPGLVRAQWRAGKRFPADSGGGGEKALIRGPSLTAGLRGGLRDPAPTHTRRVPLPVTELAHRSPLGGAEPGWGRPRLAHRPSRGASDLWGEGQGRPCPPCLLSRLSQNTFLSPKDISYGQEFARAPSPGRECPSEPSESS